MTHFRDHDYGGGFSVKYEQSIEALYELSKTPEAEFFDTHMSGAFADLVAAIREYKKSAINRVWWEGNGIANIPPEWLHGDEKSEKRWEEAVDTMNDVATGIWDAYCRFVKAARTVLKVELNEEA